MLAILRQHVLKLVERLGGQNVCIQGESGQQQPPGFERTTDISDLGYLCSAGATQWIKINYIALPTLVLDEIDRLRAASAHWQGPMGKQEEI